MSNDLESDKQNIPPTDLARRRVQQILLSEKPLYEQKDASYNLSKYILSLISDRRSKFELLMFNSPHKVMGWNIFGQRPVDLWCMSKHSEEYRLSAANFNSRYVKMRFDQT